MKSKKKFLLLGVGVMGALALGVGATSTFAWFGVANATAVAGPKAGEATTMTVTKQDHTAEEITLPILVSVVDNTSATTKLLLAQYDASGNTEKLVSGYVDNGGVFHKESDTSKFPVGEGNTAALSSTLDITVALDFTKVYSSAPATAGWSGGTIGDGYSYGNKPAVWKTATGVEYSYSTLVGSLALDTVNVGIKQTASYDRGRLFESTAVANNPLYANSTPAAGTAEASGTLKDYFKVATGVALTGIGNGSVVVKDNLPFYVFGDETENATGTADGATGRSAEGSDVTVKFEAKVE